MFAQPEGDGVRPDRGRRRRLYAQVMEVLAGAVRPDLAGASVAGLVPVLLTGNGNAWIPPLARTAEHVVLFVLDGLGWQAVEEHRALMPTLAAMEGGAITTVA